MLSILVGVMKGDRVELLHVVRKFKERSTSGAVSRSGRYQIEQEQQHALARPNKNSLLSIASLTRTGLQPTINVSIDILLLVVKT